MNSIQILYVLTNVPSCSASPFSGHLRSAGNICPHYARGNYILTGGWHSWINNEHCHSFAFARVHSKFVKDIVPSAQQCHWHHTRMAFKVDHVKGPLDKAMVAYVTTMTSQAKYARWHRWHSLPLLLRMLYICLNKFLKMF